MHVEHFVIESAGRTAELDLCVDHAAELNSLLDTYPKRRRRRTTVEVLNVEDIPKKLPPSKKRA